MDLLAVQNLSTEQIRTFLVRRKFLCGEAVTERTYNAICEREIVELPQSVRRELCIYIDGYLTVHLHRRIPEGQSLTPQKGGLTTSIRVI